MSIITDKKEVADLKEAGKRHAHILQTIGNAVKPGVTTDELNALAEKMVSDNGDTPAFKGYQPEGASFPFPAAVCISVNDEIVHGIPGNRELKPGDIVGLDFGIVHEGLVTDSAITVPVGEVSEEIKQLIDTTRQALYAGIDAAKLGNRTGDISSAIEQSMRSDSKKSYGLVRELGGHGVGRKVHEEPYIANFGTPGTGTILREGMVLALEPMFNLGGADIDFDDDGYTIRTRDKSFSAHFEHTIRITKEGPEIITEFE